MGIGMGGRLIGAGFPLTVYNRTPERAADLVKRGAKLASSPAEAAADAEIVFSMVSDDAVSRRVWLDKDGILTSAKPGTIGVECSTISPAWARELAAAAEKHGCLFLDAPVTGTKPHAASGELLFLVGGSAAALGKARPALAVMSRKIVHMGPNGSGALMKLLNNFLAGVQLVSLAEAMAVIERSGLNRESALDILNNGAPGSPLIKTLSARMVARDYAVNFELQLMQKDLTYAVSEARTHGVDLGTASAAIELFKKARDRGWGEKDFSAVVEAIR
jgi:3-hydroxyisobutyrate dehydrogenase